MSVVRLLLAAAAVSGFLGVGAGAFASHALEARLAPDLLDAFETGVRYQMYHALALGGAALAAARWPDPAWTAAGWLFLAGTVLFSGSLYGLALSGIRWLGAVTPLGGLCFLAGWAASAVAAWRSVG